MIESDIKALASDPTAPGEVLQRLALIEPSLRPAIARNPATYPALIEWLAELHDPAVDAALGQRIAASQAQGGSVDAPPLGAPTALRSATGESSLPNLAGPSDSDVRRAKGLVICGFAVALIGIVLMSAAVNPYLGLVSLVAVIAGPVFVVAGMVMKVRSDRRRGSHRAPVTALRPGTVPHTNNLAVAALICAFVVWPAGLILGHVALSQIRRTGEQGRGLAITAVTIGWLAAAACVVGVLVFTGALNS